MNRITHRKILNTSWDVASVTKVTAVVSVTQGRQCQIGHSTSSSLGIAVENPRLRCQVDYCVEQKESQGCDRRHVSENCSSTTNGVLQVNMSVTTLIKRSFSFTKRAVLVFHYALPLGMFIHSMLPAMLRQLVARPIV